MRTLTRKHKHRAGAGQRRRGFNDAGGGFTGGQRSKPRNGLLVIAGGDGRELLVASAVMVERMGNVGQGDLGAVVLQPLCEHPGGGRDTRRRLPRNHQRTHRHRSSRRLAKTNKTQSLAC
ncbi:hypothetical protein NM962_22745 [Mycobacterium sp. SVM_VP21]|nr:hypothetical protein NM962_22745 [Mycobacterium sp. SVM_VP21]